jgi:hypothetical protein
MRHPLRNNGIVNQAGLHWTATRTVDLQHDAACIFVGECTLERSANWFDARW